MTFEKIGAVALLAFMGGSAAQAAGASFRCEGKNLLTRAPVQPFAVEIRNNTVTLNGVEELGKSFPLIQRDERFFVFKNAAKTQGGNIDRSTLAIDLYVLDKAKKMLAVSIAGHCAAL